MHAVAGDIKNLIQDYDAGETELTVQLGVLNQNVNPGVSGKKL